jgi:hypothetical protein
MSPSSQPRSPRLVPSLLRLVYEIKPCEGSLEIEPHPLVQILQFHNIQRAMYQDICSIIRGCIQKFPDLVDNEINNNKNKHSLRSNTKGYSNKTR